MNNQTIHKLNTLELLEENQITNDNLKYLINELFIMTKDSLNKEIQYLHVLLYKVKLDFFKMKIKTKEFLLEKYFFVCDVIIELKKEIRKHLLV